ncbi:hypothetical protein FN846DRAFT_933602 [Sphaerosporella brunnea]|uniref:Centromere protein Cenp-K n=1 Tax=Sphaerosporella brunnea TaxID=1250544 RepID=A0A5J5F628_9PEZI|nr:hypothetical protein FN846DRAFT_933602 [Sphaerosporella brunnea]
MATPTPQSVRSRLWGLTNLSHSTLHDVRPLNEPPSAALIDPELKKAKTELRRLLVDEEMAIATLQTQLADLPADPQRRLRAEIAANRETFNTPGYYPPPASPLNKIIAYRYVLSAITAYAELIPISRREVEDMQKELAAAKATLNEQEALKAVLEKRVAELKNPEAILVGADDSVVGMKMRSKRLRTKTGRTIKALHTFFERHLVTALAMEELGGPIVGLGREAVDGKKLLRKAKGQMTIEEAFRAGRKKERERERERRARNDEEEEEEDEEEDEVVGELESLLEDLMEKSLEADPYVALKRESAVARFLVRAKVAEFHPRDAKRLKLLNFAGTFED